MLIENSSVTNSQNGTPNHPPTPHHFTFAFAFLERAANEQPYLGVRIKTVYDATGSVKDVTYKNIKLSNISKYGIVIEQDYENGNPTGDPSTGVPITDLAVESITGTVASGATDVYILCGSSASCSGWTWAGVDISGGKKATNCKSVPNGASC